MKATSTIALGICLSVAGCLNTGEDPTSTTDATPASLAAQELGIQSYVLMRGEDRDYVQQLDADGRLLATFERLHGTTSSFQRWTDERGDTWAIDLDRQCIERNGAELHCFTDGMASPAELGATDTLELSVRRLVATQNDYEEMWGLQANLVDDDSTSYATAKCCAKTCFIDIGGTFCELGCPAGGTCSGSDHWWEAVGVTCCTYCVEGSCGVE